MIIELIYSFKSLFTRQNGELDLRVSASYGFDYLSILQVKINKDSSKKNLDNYYKCFDNLLNQLNSELFFDILESKEYRDLYNVNDKLFDLVSLAKNDLCFASEVDKMVYQRWLSKTALQDKFFTNKLSEVKIGY